MRDADVPVLRRLVDGQRDANMGAPSRLHPFPFESSGRAVDSNAFVLVGETGGRVEAVASYQRDQTMADRAEVLFAIAPTLQGRGVGTRMLEMLARVAWTEDITTFDAWVPRDNEAVMRMFLDSGYTAEQRLEHGFCRVTLSLAHTPAYQERAAERSEIAATASMNSFFHPRTVAIVGASRERGKIGSEILHNMIEAGYRGRLIAIHPSATEIDGVPAVRRVTDVSGDLDLVVISVPAKAVNQVVDDCIEKGVKALVIITAGFAETGTSGRDVEAEILAKVRRAGIRMVGPNCMGLLNTDPDVRLNATFAPEWPPAGTVAMSTQSGALGLAILSYARELNIGLSTFVSVGNKADVSSNDLVRYLEPRSAHERDPALRRELRQSAQVRADRSTGGAPQANRGRQVRPIGVRRACGVVAHRRARHERRHCRCALPSGRCHSHRHARGIIRRGHAAGQSTDPARQSRGDSDQRRRSRHSRGRRVRGARAEAARALRRRRPQSFDRFCFRKPRSQTPWT